jgi:hypothetical protein
VVKFPGVDPAERWGACNRPDWAKDWSFDTYPLTGDREALRKMRAWCDDPKLNGVVLFGDPGAGKSGLALAALRLCAERGDRINTIDGCGWANVCYPEYLRLVREKRLLAEPAPCWWVNAYDLERQFSKARRGRLYQSDGGPDDNLVTEDQLFGELARVSLFVIDDLDVSEQNQHKDAMLLRILERAHMPKRRTIITMNHDPRGVDARPYLSDRVRSRISATQHFVVAKVQASKSLR